MATVYQYSTGRSDARQANRVAVSVHHALYTPHPSSLQTLLSTKPQATQRTWESLDRPAQAAAQIPIRSAAAVAVAAAGAARAAEKPPAVAVLPSCAAAATRETPHPEAHQGLEMAPSLLKQVRFHCSLPLVAHVAAVAASARAAVAADRAAQQQHFVLDKDLQPNSHSRNRRCATWYAANAAASPDVAAAA